MLYLLFVLYFINILYGTFVSIKKRNSIQILASWFWLSFAVLPFTFLSKTFPIQSVSVQTWGIYIVGFTILMADYYALKQNKILIEIPNFNISPDQRRLIGFTVLFIIVFIPLSKYLRDGIPLLEVAKNKQDLALSRNFFSRSTGLSQILNYFNNVYLNFFAPLVIAILWKKSRLYLSLFIFLWVSLFSLSSSAIAPFVILILTLSILFTSVFFDKNLNLFILFLTGAIFTFSLFGLVSAKNQYESLVLQQNLFSLKSEPYVSLPTTYGDLYRFSLMTTDSGNCRFCSFGSHDNKIGSVFDYLRYRTLLDPIEVSNRWYIYYSNSDSKRSFISTLTLKENPKASAIIGRWAYYERFPLLYSGFLNANASIDAESYSFGSLGWFLIIFILVVLRLCVGVLLASKNFIFQCLGLAAISHLAFLTFQAGPFAIVFAQGLLIIPLVTFFIILLKRFAKL